MTHKIDTTTATYNHFCNAAPADCVQGTVYCFRNHAGAKAIPDGNGEAMTIRTDYRVVRLSDNEREAARNGGYLGDLLLERAQAGMSVVRLLWAGQNEVFVPRGFALVRYDTGDYGFKDVRELLHNS